LGFNKLFTYAFDVRPHLYKVLEKAGFDEEARLKKHHLFGNAFVDVLIHSKFNKNDTLPKGINK
jgi:RimJ/RimL family protein N-acetyltransferase